MGLYCFLSIVMRNVRLLANKTKELTAILQSQREYGDCTETCYLHSRWFDASVKVMRWSAGLGWTPLSCGVNTNI